MRWFEFGCTNTHLIRNKCERNPVLMLNQISNQKLIEWSEHDITDMDSHIRWLYAVLHGKGDGLSQYSLVEVIRVSKLHLNYKTK